MNLRLLSACIAAACSVPFTAASVDAQVGGASPAPPAGTTTGAVVPPALVPVPLGEAIQKAATALMTKAPEPDTASDRREIVIDPLVDGYTGAQNVTTRKMGETIASLVKQTYTRFKVAPFTSTVIAKQPLVLLGTFRPINTKMVPGGPTDAFHICLALLDFKTGKIVSKGVARALPQGIDVAPTQFFQDSPIWIADSATTAYIKSCQATKVGDQIDQGYADRILVASLISDAINAYDGKRYKDAAALYQSALRTPGGDQLRVHNGIYLASWRLKWTGKATAAFGTLVDHGLKGSKIGVNFLFYPSSTIFFTPKAVVAPYGMWLKVIGERGTAGNACLEIVGHTSVSGPTALNDRLSVLRAQYVRDRLIEQAPALTKRTIATGIGSREVIVGTDWDGPHNAIDRRVEFKTIQCST